MVLDEEAKARAEVWKYAFGFINTCVVKCAIEVEIPDILEKHGAPISLHQLSSAVGVPPETLFRIMRFLVYNGIFKKTEPPQSKASDGDESSSVYYAQTPLSRLFTRDNLGPFTLLQGTPQGPSGGITAEALRIGKRPDLKSDKHTWTDPIYGKRVFTDAMACHARLTASAIINNYPEAFEGIGSLVDVGGRQGMALSMLVKAFPWVRGISFDLPEIVAKAPPLDGIEFVGGSMFESIPEANAVMLMWVLHDWGDKACIDILKKCKEAVPADTGKVMIVEAVVDEEGEGDEYTGARLSLDMTMMAVTVMGKERTYREWTHLLNAAGFSRHTVKNIKTVESVIVAYP
ncbi:hypothetical protein Pfo_016243 [Paulownia fortunei]|nr:hypothetical protein Pfo_016243 [Paulownia fortunei]